MRGVMLNLGRLVGVRRVGVRRVAVLDLSLASGQGIQLQGASVTVNGGLTVWWTLTVQVVDQNGQILATTQRLGTGSSTFNLTLAPINGTGGSQLHLTGSLGVFADEAKTHPLAGSPVTASSGVIAAIPVVTATPGAVTGLVATRNGDNFTLAWNRAANGPWTELQITDARGTQQLGAAGLAANPSTVESDTAGVNTVAVGAVFTTALAATFAGTAGTTTYVRARGCSGAGGNAVKGPWSAPVAMVAPPGVADMHFVNVQITPAMDSLELTAGSFTRTTVQVGWSISLQVQNRGTAAGSFTSVAGIAVANNLVQAKGQQGWNATLQPGQTSPVITLDVAAVIVTPSGQDIVPLGSGTYTLYLALGDPWSRYPVGDYGQPPETFTGPTVGASSTTVPFPGGSLSIASMLVRTMRVRVRPRGTLATARR